MYKRTIAPKIVDGFRKGFITIIYGARRVGKTVLLEQVRELLKNKDILTFNGDTEETIRSLGTTSEVKLTQLVKNHDTIFVDEAQNIPNIGKALKILIDLFPEKNIIVTGSSSLALAKGAKESLTGRNYSHTLYPLSTTELAENMPDFKKANLLDDQLIFGGYPHVYSLSAPNEKKKYLENLVADYLFKDVISLENLEYPHALKKLAILLAHQIGNEASLNELAKATEMTTKTVARYIDLLEKSFVIFHLDAYSTNQRNEISKNKKYYFYDLGIRNALIDQFAPLADRVDVGKLWENFLIVERKKKNEYTEINAQGFFWRNYQGAEVDYIELYEGKLSAFEFKWKKDGVRTPKQFSDVYKIKASLVNKENYLEFIS